MKAQRKLPCPWCGGHDDEGKLNKVAPMYTVYTCECTRCGIDYIVRLDEENCTYTAKEDFGGEDLFYGADEQYEVKPQHRYIDECGNPLFGGEWFDGKITGGGAKR